MADKDESPKDESERDEPIIRTGPDGHEPPVVRDKRRVDPETGDVREPEGGAASDEDEAEALSAEDQALLDEASRDLVADMRNDMLRAQAELVNFRQRVERDRAANREAVIAEVLRSLLPAIDDLSRAEAHGDLVEGAPLTLVAQKLRASFEKYGLKQVGVKGEPFDPSIHEAVVQLPSPDATEQTVADVIEPGYILGERLVRAAKVAVSVPAE
jgi:molecular chaperone GrpE